MDKTFNASKGKIPALGEGKRGEDGYLGYLLLQAANVYQTRMARALDDFSMTPPQFLTMTMIAAYPGLSNADIARLVLLTPQTVSVIIANLEKACLISRRQHEVHGRIKHLELTNQGLLRLKSARRRVHALEKELIGNLPEESEALTRHWLATTAHVMAKSTLPGSGE